MLTKLTIAVLAACAVATSAPAAHAEHAWVSCGVVPLGEETVTSGADFVVRLRGVVVSPTPGEAVSIRCYVRVDGTDVGGTPTGTGTNVAATTGVVIYDASDTQQVDLCTEWTAGGESGTTCAAHTTPQIPPQPVIDLLDQVFQIVEDATAGLDPVVCGVIKTLAVPGIVNPLSGVTGLFVDPDDCDIYLAGERLFDFAPFYDED